MANLKTLTEKRKDMWLVDPVTVVIEEGLNTRYDYGDIPALAQSILENGMTTPIVVHVVGDDLVLSSGHRRMKAVQLLIEQGYEVKTIPAIAEGKGYTSEQRIVDLYVNNDGKRFTILEEGYVFLKLENIGWSQTDISKKIGKSQSAVSAALKLSKSSRRIQNLIIEGKIDAQTVLAVLRKMDDEEEVFNTLLAAIETSASETGKRKNAKVTVPGVTKPSPLRKITELSKLLQDYDENGIETEGLKTAMTVLEFLKDEIDIDQLAEGLLKD